MNYSICRLLLFAALVIGFIGGFDGNSTSIPYASVSATDSFTSASELSRYKSWTRVNRAPVLMERNISLLCAPASAIKKSPSPHAEKYLNVFVNPIGRKAMMGEKEAKFPTGSMIVKEKLATANSPAPELITAMVKRDPGFYPEGGDWEFLVLTGDAKTIQEQGRLPSCTSCHAAMRVTDFVFRNYLTSGDRER